MAEGELPPGSPIEPALIGNRIASSITPIRDALHRLTGERLVEAPHHNGFRVPLPTEAALRDLYNWNSLVLGLATKQLPAGIGQEEIDRPAVIVDIVTRTAELFLDIASAAGSVELTIIVGLLNDRLATFRRAEGTILTSLTDEISGLAQVTASGDRTALANALTRYHRRRISAVADILAISRLSASS